ncbi:MAG: hypothetical protein H6999_07120 [Hahellaceae bacterium]|nr:hypothetical protein [Hahellaceae bacterium]
MTMKQTLEAQKSRLLAELKEAEEKIRFIKSQAQPDFKILNYYMDVVERNRQLLEMIDCHLFGMDSLKRVSRQRLAF